MKKLLYMAVAAIAALSSCTSEDIINGNGNDNGNGNVNGNAPVFTATIEGEGTRTTIGTGSDDSHKKVLWSNGDEISINGVTYTTTSTAETATFTTSATAPTAVDGKYYAVYPSSITFNISTQTLTLPAIQTYDATTNGISNVPMVAVSQTTTLQFMNICALLAITVPSSEMSSVQKITVSSDKQLNGSVTLNDNPFGLTLIQSPSNEEKTVTLDCTNNGANTTIPAEGKTFYVSIPPQTYGYLQFDVTDGTNTKTMKTKAGANISVERNKIYPIAFEENQTPKLKIKVTSSDIATLQKIKVVTDQIISGTTSKELVYDVPEAQQSPAADGTVYSINIPAQTYEYYKIYLSADGTTYKEAMASKGTVGAISGPLNIDYAKNAVQLWADGPYFALFNVGATITDYSEANVVADVLSESDFPDPWDYYYYINSEEYEEEVAKQYTAEYVGGYFTWGGSTTKTNDNYTGSDFDSDNLKPENDTATKLWGSAWRMPTYAEYNDLLAKTTSTWMTGLDGSQYVTGCTMHGRKYEGKDSYSGISVFFPSAGYYDQNESKVQSIGTEGGYWASSNCNDNDSRSYFLNAKNNNTSTSYKDNGYLVRAVLK